MRKHPLIRRTSLLILLSILSGSLRASGGEQPQTPAPDRRLTAAGSDDILWLVIAEWDEDHEEFTRQFIYRDAGSDRLRPVTIAPQRTRIAVASVVGNTLHAFFRDGSHIRFSKTRRFRGHPLPGKDVPLALAGEKLDGQGRLWAVVPQEVAAKVREEWEKRTQSRATEPGDERGASRPSAQPEMPALRTDEPRPGEIVMYDGTAWQPGMELPAGCSGAGQTWLTVSGGRFHLFWTSERDSRHVQYACFDGGRWTAGSPISLSAPIEKAAAAVMNKQVVFAALLKQDDLATLRCGQWSRAARAPAPEPWNTIAPVLDENSHELTLPVGSTLGLFNDRLAIMRFGKPEPELGLWVAAAGGKPDEPFEPLPAPSDGEGAASRRGLEDLVGTLLVAAVLLILFWRRQESIASRLELPVELQVAGPARRAAAFLVDAAPAAAIMLLIWFDPIASFAASVKVAARAGEPMREAPSQVLWAWFWFRVMYTSYSAIFECIMATTPGKRLLNCVVVSETLDRASFVQIAIRNISRMIELEPFLKIWPFMLIVFFTRNRQRLGDLLARTIVVEHRSETSQLDDADESREDL